MKSILHKASERGVAEHGWLHSRFSFSFADWYEPSRMGFGVLRVINDDVIDAHSGFDKHPHKDMEIITIVTEGAVTHGDSMGNTYAVPAGDVQVMSAGTGVVHSEHNREDSTLKLFQIWISPRTKGLIPRYEQKSFGKAVNNKIELLVSGNEAEEVENGALFINQDAYVSRVVLDESREVEYALKRPLNGIYVFVVNGNVRIDEHDLSDRDALGIAEAKEILISAATPAEVLIFEVPMQ